MIEIEQETSTYWTVTTKKGRSIGVSLGIEGLASIYLEHTGLSSRPALGRHFRNDTSECALNDAIEEYRDPDLKEALQALVSQEWT